MTLPDLIPFDRSRALLGIRAAYALRLVTEGKLKKETIRGKHFITKESALAFLDSLRPSAYR